MIITMRNQQLSNTR